MRKEREKAALRLISLVCFWDGENGTLPTKVYVERELPSESSGLSHYADIRGG